MLQCVINNSNDNLKLQILPEYQVCLNLAQEILLQRQKYVPKQPVKVYLCNKDVLLFQSESHLYPIHSKSNDLFNLEREYSLIFTVLSDYNIQNVTLSEDKGPVCISILNFDNFMIISSIMDTNTTNNRKLLRYFGLANSGLNIGEWFNDNNCYIWNVSCDDLDGSLIVEQHNLLKHKYAKDLILFEQNFFKLNVCNNKGSLAADMTAYPASIVGLGNFGLDICDNNARIVLDGNTLLHCKTTYADYSQLMDCLFKDSIVL